MLDDEVDITQLLANYLRSHGYRVTPVHNGRSLMALMPLDPPALVLLDLGLPGEDGFLIPESVTSCRPSLSIRLFRCPTISPR